MWDDTMVEMSMDTSIKDLTKHYGLEPGDTLILYRN